MNNGIKRNGMKEKSIVDIACGKDNERQKRVDFFFLDCNVRKFNFFRFAQPFANSKGIGTLRNICVPDVIVS